MEVWDSSKDIDGEVIHSLSDRDAKVWVYFMLTAVIGIVIAVIV